MNDNKAVLISIQPKWCELIASGKKTVEVRKTRPKLETPFKGYIYCTANKQGTHDLLEIHGIDDKIRRGNCKVIGEFVCNFIGRGGWYLTPDHPMWVDDFIEESCLTSREMYEYTKGKDFYEWHISNLVIYDKPRDLGEFIRPCATPFQCDECSELVPHFGCGRTITRPPQSWCYVEGGGDDE